MTDYVLSDDELQTLRRFQTEEYPPDIDPQHFAKLLSLALIEQHEGGDRITASGSKRLKAGRRK